MFDHPRARSVATTGVPALARLALFLAKRHKRGRKWGWLQVVYTDPNQLGLINLNGAVVAPRPFRSWRATAEHRR